MNQLDQLKRHTTVVADTGNFRQLAQFAPQDATTNPSLILKAVQHADYAPLLAETVAAASPGAPLEAVIDDVLVRFGREILKVVPGRVSTEVDARLSFDSAATVARARHLTALYEAGGVDRERVLIKIAATWEGIRAAALLERDGIRCNLTLLFAFCQAVACGDAGVRLISPFVGRIHDWHKKAAGAAWVEADNAGASDPGVRSVTAIFNHYKRHGMTTQVMGASFRNIGQVQALAGCDLLTISPELLAELQQSDAPLEPQLNAAAARTLDLPAVHFDEAQFRWALNEDAMASDKLAEGIRAFAADAVKLDRLIEGLRPVMRCDRTAAWAALAGHWQAHGRGFDLREAFARDPQRFERFGFRAPEVFADLSKNLIDAATLNFLLELARECAVEPQRDAMLRGEVANATEGRAVLHTALRTPRGAAPLGTSAATAPLPDAVHGVLDRMLAYAESVRADEAITDIVNIGIGGSDLGPQMAVPALHACTEPLRRRLHFVSNVDGHDIAVLLPRLRAGNTLFIVASKTFTTQETMANAGAARDWFVQQGGSDIARHFAATTTNVAAAAQFGITTTFGFWDWVGGRYSLWSAIGLPIAIAIGAANFRALLAGAHAMDRHFADTPAAQNLPLLLGLLDVWYRNFHGFTSRSVAPYHQGLARLPAYLQQLEMESNGKRVDTAGAPLPYGTSPVVWGEPGTNGQHAFFQMLHQGTDVVPVEFIAVRMPAHGLAGQHTKLLANCLAQSQALMLGKTAAEALAEQAPTAPPGLTPDVLAQHRSFPGNRPSTTLLLEALTPHALGALIALYEHRVFTSGAVWGINSFDQWGVELGKALCNQLLPRFASGDVAGLDGSTAGLLRRLSA